MKKILLIFFGALGSLILVAAFYYGLLSPVNLSEKTTGGEILIYQERLGDYRDSGQTIEFVSQELKNNFNIDCTVSFGIYYDNPQEISPEKQRSDLGCILPESALGRLSEIESYPILKIKRNPVVKNIVGEFPYRNKISFTLGVLKMYPEFSKYLLEHNYQASPSMEQYDVQGHRIEYRMVLVEK